MATYLFFMDNFCLSIVTYASFFLHFGVFTFTDSFFHPHI